MKKSVKHFNLFFLKTERERDSYFSRREYYDYNRLDSHNKDRNYERDRWREEENRYSQISSSRNYERENYDRNTRPSPTSSSSSSRISSFESNLNRRNSWEIDENLNSFCPKIIHRKTASGITRSFFSKYLGGNWKMEPEIPGKFDLSSKKLRINGYTLNGVLDSINFNLFKSFFSF